MASSNSRPGILIAEKYRIWEEGGKYTHKELYGEGEYQTNGKTRFCVNYNCAFATGDHEDDKLREHIRSCKKIVVQTQAGKSKRKHLGEFELHGLPREDPSSVASVGTLGVICAKCGERSKDRQKVERSSKFGSFWDWQFRHENPIAYRPKGAIGYTYHYLRIRDRSDR